MFVCVAGRGGNMCAQTMRASGVRAATARGRVLRVHATPAAARAAHGAARAPAAQLSVQPARARHSPDTVLLRPTTPSIPQTARRLSE